MWGALVEWLRSVWPGAAKPPQDIQQQAALRRQQAQAAADLARLRRLDAWGDYWSEASQERSVDERDG